MPQTRRPRGIRMSDDVHQALKVRAAKTGRTMEDIHDAILRDGLGLEAHPEVRAQLEKGRRE